MRVIDTNRLIGPLPTEPGESNVTTLLARLDKLRINEALVTPSWHVFGDPRAGVEYEHWISELDDPRLTLVPCVIPAAVQGAGAPLPDGATIVRACPQRHRFELLSSAANDHWRELADRSGILLLDGTECGLAAVGSLCAAHPRLKVLLVNPGYREVRRVGELLHDHANLTADIGSLNTSGAVEWLATRLGSHRLVFGTGAPLSDDGGPRFALDHLFLTDAEIADIAHQTWQRLREGEQ